MINNSCLLIRRLFALSMLQMFLLTWEVWMATQMSTSKRASSQISKEIKKPSSNRAKAWERVEASSFSPMMRNFWSRLWPWMISKRSTRYSNTILSTSTSIINQFWRVFTVFTPSRWTIKIQCTSSWWEIVKNVRANISRRFMIWKVVSLREKFLEPHLSTQLYLRTRIYSNWRKRRIVWNSRPRICLKSTGRLGLISLFLTISISWTTPCSSLLSSIQPMWSTSLSSLKKYMTMQAILPK